MGRHEPDVRGECMRAIMDEGGSCKRCDIPQCYRKGMTKAQATADNERLCREKREKAVNPPLSFD